jgi:hypothetical protein
MHTYIRIHAYIHTYIRADIHIDIHTYIHTSQRVRGPFRLLLHSFGHRIGRIGVSYRLFSLLRLDFFVFGVRVCLCVCVCVCVCVQIGLTAQNIVVVSSILEGKGLGGGGGP